MKHNRGFSLVELMVVVGIMGILAAIAIPRFQTYQAKAKRTEAQSLLGQIFTLMTVNFNDYGTYAANDRTNIVVGSPVGRQSSTASICDFTTGWPSQIGFAISPCVTATNLKQMPFYYYWLGTVTQNTFIAIAKDAGGVVNQCSGSIVDELQIDQEKKLQINIDGVNCIKGNKSTNTTTPSRT